MTTLQYLNYQKNTGTPVKSNFTNFEKEFITELVLKHQAILENKRNDSTMCRRKTETWERLTEEFNNFDPKITKRTCKQLKKCWENLKTRAKKATLEMKSEEVFGFEESKMIDIKDETLLDEAPKVADLIAMQLKPISDVIKPIDVDDDSDDDDDNDDDVSKNTTVVVRTSSESGTQTPVEKPKVVKKMVPIKVPNVPKITVVKPHTSASILTKLGVKPTTSSSSTVYRSSVSTPSPILKPVAPPKNTPSTSNPVLRHTLSTSTLERQLQEEEQKLKVQFLKRKLEMAEEEHQETLSLLKSKKQYVELKKQQLVQRGLEKSGISNDTSSGIHIDSVVGNAKMNTSKCVNGVTNKSTVDDRSDHSSDSESSKDDNV